MNFNSRLCSPVNFLLVESLVGLRPRRKSAGDLRLLLNMPLDILFEVRSSGISAQRRLHNAF